MMNDPRSGSMQIQNFQLTISQLCVTEQSRYLEKIIKSKKVYFLSHFVYLSSDNASFNFSGNLLNSSLFSSDFASDSIFSHSTRPSSFNVTGLRSVANLNE